MSIQFISWLFDLVVVPRRTQRLVASLTAEDLESLRDARGLPYHAQEVQALVWELKYYGNKRAAALAGAFLSEELMGLAAEELGAPLLVPVPMHRSRLHERGHNQTEVLCQAALKALHKDGLETHDQKCPEKQSGGCPRRGATRGLFSGHFCCAPYDYAPHALRRIKNTPHQQGLERAVRLHNVKNSMQADAKLVQGRVCVAVDDVTTTGATLKEAARALKAAGALRVHAVALAQS
jgi:predicted amidophosphoribosyltransferase